MTISPELMIPLFVFMTVVLGLVAGYVFWRQHETSKSLDQRLDRLTGHATPTTETASILRGELYPEETRGLLDQLLARAPNLTRLFEQADVRWKPQTFWLLSGALALGGAAVPIGLRWNPALGAVGLSLGILPYLYLNFLRKRRLGKFGAQLCEALELVARALRAGHSLAAAMKTVAEEMPDPVAKEFGRVYDEQNLGISIEQAMRSLGERISNVDLGFFVTAVIIQRQTGGDLAEILDKIGYLIRERFKIMGMVKALTGEGRISGVVLIALPFGLFLMMLRISPDYVALLWEHQIGRYMSVVGIILMILGALVIRKIVNIKV